MSKERVKPEVDEEALQRAIDNIQTAAFDHVMKMSKDVEVTYEMRDGRMAKVIRSTIDFEKAKKVMEEERNKRKTGGDSE